MGDAQCSKQPEGCLNRHLSCTYDALFGGYNNEFADFSLECFRNPFLIRTLIARTKVSRDIPLVRTCDKISFVTTWVCLFFDHDLPKKHISRFHSDPRCQIYPQCARRQLECLNILARRFLWKLIRVC